MVVSEGNAEGPRKSYLKKSRSFVVMPRETRRTVGYSKRGRHTLWIWEDDLFSCHQHYELVYCELMWKKVSITHKERNQLSRVHYSNSKIYSAIKFWVTDEAKLMDCQIFCTKGWFNATLGSTYFHFLIWHFQISLIPQTLKTLSTYKT